MRVSMLSVFVLVSCVAQNGIATAGPPLPAETIGTTVLERPEPSWFMLTDREASYIFDGADAALAFDRITRPVCLFGHTHLPVAFARERSRIEAHVPDQRGRVTVRVAPDTWYLINPGSVGQPRDGDVRAGFALVDDDAGTVELRRVDYPVALAQQAIRDAGLPLALATRLGAGR